MRLEEIPDDESGYGHAENATHQKKRMNTHYSGHQSDQTGKNPQATKSDADNARPVLQVPHAIANRGAHHGHNKKEDGPEYTEAGEQQHGASFVVTSHGSQETSTHDNRQAHTDQRRSRHEIQDGEHRHTAGTWFHVALLNRIERFLGRTLIPRESGVNT